MSARGGGPGALAITAAASVPSSSTMTNALWRTRDTESRPEALAAEGGRWGEREDRSAYDPAAPPHRYASLAERRRSAVRDLALSIKTDLIARPLPGLARPL